MLLCLFTFHYVSIKTSLSCRFRFFCSWFTFHYVSIKTFKRSFSRFSLTHLHSTMYLLKPVTHMRKKKKEKQFTFHYVSIKTCRSLRCLMIWIDLHSTMYLLKLSFSQETTANQDDLHSTMYLLKRVIHSNYFWKLCAFTFHYVSIKTTLLRHLHSIFH